MSDTTSAYVALAGTLFGGAGFKIIEAFLGRKKEGFTQEKTMRDELRDELKSLREEAAKLHDEAEKLRAELDEWRSRYYSLVASVAKGDVKGALKKINDDEKQE